MARHNKICGKSSLKYDKNIILTIISMLLRKYIKYIHIYLCVPLIIITIKLILIKINVEDKKNMLQSVLKGE